MKDGEVFQSQMNKEHTKELLPMPENYIDSFSPDKTHDLTDLNRSFQMDQSNSIEGAGQLQSTESDAANQNGLYFNFTDYLTEEGQQKYVYPIPVEPGQVLHVQLNLPNSNELDYDLYLFEVDPADLSMTLVDLSQNRTYLNGTEGTAPENVGVYNTSDKQKEYAAFVISERGSSISQPFTLHIGINHNSDIYEPDENVRTALNFTLQPIGSTNINLRSMDSLVDNDWFSFTIPSDKNYTSIHVTLDDISQQTGYKVELYQLVNSELRKVPMTASGQANITSGPYYIRVTAIESTQLSQTNYTLSILPDYQADEIIITEFGGGNFATYQFGTFYRVKGGEHLQVKGVAGYKGYVLPEAPVTVTVINEHWNPEDLRYRTQHTLTDASGNFSVSIPTAPSTAKYSYFISGAINFTHYFDYGYVKANAGTAVQVEPIYFFAYSIRS